MKNFFKFTNGKFILACPLVMILSVILFSWMSFITLSSYEVCVPSLPGDSNQGPAPTPQPFTVSTVVSDIQEETYMDGDTNCIGSGPSVQMANFLYHGYYDMYDFVYYIFLPIIGGYILSCCIMSIVGKFRGHKKNKPDKTKK